MNLKNPALGILLSLMACQAWGQQAELDSLVNSVND